jgi:hypothetical protein
VELKKIRFFHVLGAKYCRMLLIVLIRIRNLKSFRILLMIPDPTVLVKELKIMFFMCWVLNTVESVECYF